MSKECFALFKGWDNHDCSPSLIAVFSTYEKALAKAKELENEDVELHKTSFPDGSICWHDMTRVRSDLHYRSQAFEKLEKDGNEFMDEVVYIKWYELQ